MISGTRLCLPACLQVTRFCEALELVPGIVAAGPGPRVRGAPAAQGLEVYILPSVALHNKEMVQDRTGNSRLPFSRVSSDLAVYMVVLRTELAVQEVVVTTSLMNHELSDLVADTVAAERPVATA